MSVDDGRIVLPDGMSYRLLVLPQCPTMTPACCKRSPTWSSKRDRARRRPDALAELVGFPQLRRRRETARRRALGRLRRQVGRRACLRQGQDRLRQIARGNACGGGNSAGFRVRQSKGRPPPRLHPSPAADADIYFVANQREIFAETECTFRTSGKTPELWQAETGKIEKARFMSEPTGVRRAVVVRAGWLRFRGLS